MFVGIVDLHALTTMHEDTSALRDNSLQLAMDYISAGINPEKTPIILQSLVPEHCELHLLLSMVTPVSWLERTPTYKDKRDNQPEDINHGLLTYPVLQAADIVLYKASLVPVGRDQAAHLELSREIVRRFNTLYGDTFPEPQAVFTEAPVVLGTDGTRKMSKSLANTIEVFAPPEEIRRQVMSMVTDTERIKRTDPGRPEVCNVCQMHRFFGDDWEEIQAGERTARTGCVDTKKLLAERIIRHYAPARERYLELLADPHALDEVLREGAERVRPLAEATMAEVHEKMGLR
jgi:tryptophanyl-tRNA synthetase